MSWTSIISAIVIGAHGIGHILGWGPAIKLTWESPTTNLNSWLFDGASARVMATLLFGIATIGFIATAFAMYTDQPWMRTTAITSAVISLLATIIFPHALPLSSIIGCTIVNIGVLVLVGTLQFPR
ncbi:hypothetical protein [Liquorilactobacillus satsumensis]|uniref:hypothetical protein n=1 Tax=Liquorilactobacillus satsumensis TaxID=259059 RepID=UPI0039E9F878